MTSENTKNAFFAMLNNQKAKADTSRAEVMKEETPQPTAKDQEVDDIDISDIWNDTAEVSEAANVLKFEIPKATHTAPRIEVVKYTDISFLVKGEDTFLIREELKGLGGIYRSKWNNHGSAWMFAEKRRAEVEMFLSEIL